MKPVIEKMADSGVYLSPYSMRPPPAERTPSVIQFELTTGCKWNGCTYCDMYKDQEYAEKSLDEYRDHVDAVWEELERSDKKSIDRLKRVFIGGGNALAVDKDVLNAAVLYTIKSFKDRVGKLPSRVAAYGNTRDIVEKAKKYYRSGDELVSDLKFVGCGGVCGDCSKDIFGEKIALSMIYWGMESGSDEVLKYANTGYDSMDVIRAGRLLKDAKIRISLMVMPGLGGAKYYDSHVSETVYALNQIQPEFITFMGLVAGDGSAYARIMRKEIDMGENIPLTSDELRLQTAAMIEGLRFRTTIGAHGSDVHGNWCNNPFPIGSIYAHYPEDSIALARMIRDGVQPSEEFVFQQKELKEYHGGERNDDNTFIDVIAGAFMSSSPLSVTRSGIIIVEDMAYARIF